MLSMLFVFLAGCTPKLYSIDLKYLSSGSSPVTTGDRKMVVTVAAFNDARTGGEDLKVGRVTTPLGGLTSVLPRTLTPTAAISTVVKDVLVRSGYQVSVAMPSWDLQESTIRKDWGKFLVGGNIDELEVICRNDIPIKTYEARAKLTIVMADVSTGKIVHRISASSYNSLEHVYFSEDLLEQQISLAITEAAEQAFKGSILK
jgi:hypothetical protein